MKKSGILLALCLILTAPARPGTAAKEISDVERLAGLARLWGEVKFCHPGLPGGDIDWDAALIRTLPRVRSARTADEYKQALDALLAELGDPVTRIPVSEPVPEPPRGEAGSRGPAHPFVEKTDDGIAVLTATDHTQFEDGSSSWIQMFQDFQKAFERAAETDRVLVDLRALKGAPGSLFHMTVPRFFPRLLDEDRTLPASRFLFHCGYPSQREATFAYHSDLCVRSGGVLRAQGRGRAVPEKVVVLINRRSADFSDMLDALQRGGKVVVVGEGDPDPESGIRIRSVRLPGGLTARIRCSEILGADGKPGFRPRIMVPGEARRAGLELLRGERPWPSPASDATAVPAGRPAFSVAENAYPEMEYPDREYRMLALFRFWIVIDRFYPYKDLLDHEWSDVLNEFIPRMDAAANAESYVLTLAELVTRIQDSHGTLSSPVLTRYFGTHYPALRVDSVEGRTAVTRIADDALKNDGLEKGDILVSVDGEKISARRDRLARVIPASTPGRLMSLVDMRILAGPEESTAALVFEKPTGERLALDAPRTIAGAALYREEPERPVFGILPSGFGYIDLGRLKAGEAEPALEKVHACPGLVLDMRGYPVGGSLPLGRMLARKRTAFARLVFPEFDGASGMYRRREELQSIDPAPGPAFEGPIVMLVHGRTQSAAEHTSLIMESVRDVTFVGSPSSGADGNITYTVLPGGISVGFTGLGVSHADGRTLQRRGIQPHVTVRPTLTGIRADRDEVLEKAIDVLRGRIAVNDGAGK